MVEIGDDNWIIYVDGVNCMNCELRHPDFSRDTKWDYHKYHGCGITYEHGAQIFQDSLIWINGHFKYGANNDKGNFVKHGMRDDLKEIGKKALGEKIYNGHPNEISIFNAFDCDAVS